jgi:hypothetical protein
MSRGQHLQIAPTSGDFGQRETNSRLLRDFPFRALRAEFQDFAGLAFERLANRFERGETDGPGVAGFEDGLKLIAA